MKHAKPQVLKGHPDSADLFQLLLDQGNDLVEVINEKGGRERASASVRKFYCTGATGRLRNFFADVSPADLANVRGALDRSWKRGKPASLEYRVILRDKSTRHLSSTAIPLFEDEGGPFRILLISRDITEQKHTESKLNLLAHAVSCIRDGFCLTDLENTILYVNPAACEIYGYREEELIGKNIDILRPSKKSPEKLHHILPATLRGGWNGEVVNRRKDGTEFPLELWTSSVSDDTGTPVALLAVGRDISDRVATQTDLRKIGERLQLTLDNLDIVAFEIDADGKFRLSRGKGLKKLGLEADEIVGRSIFEVYKDVPAILKAIEQALAGEGSQAEVEVNGVVWYTNYYPLRSSSGSIECVFGTAMDITKRKRAEGALIRESVLWHTLMDNIPDTIYFKDNEHRFTRINKAQARILGVSHVDEAIGKTDRDFFSSEHAEKAMADERTIMRTGIALLGKVERVPTREGKLHWFSTTKVPIRSADGTIVGIVGSSREITDLKQAEELESALYRIAEKSNSVKDLPSLYAAIHEIIGELMYAKNFYIALYDGEHDLLTFPYFVDEVDVPPVEGTAGKGLTAYVLRHGVSLLCDETKSEELDRLGEAALVGVPAPIWLGVPLMVNKKIIGAMVVQHYQDPGAYGEREQHILEFVSSQVASAIVHKRSADALRSSEAELKALFSSMSDVILVLDKTGKYIKIAPTNPALLYRPPAELLGKRLHDVFPKPKADRFLKMVQDALGSRKTVQFDYNLDIGGKEIWFSSVVSPMDEHSVILVARDVTEQRNTEAVIRQSEEKYRMLFEESLDAIIISTPAGELLDINPAGIRLFGYSNKEELLQANAAQDLYLHPQDREFFKKNLTQFGSVTDFEFFIKRKDGQKRIVLESSTAVRDASGEIKFYRGFLRDITERKRLEDQLRQAQKMEGIGTLAGGIAHDFNNLLGIILGYTSLLESKKLDGERYTASIETIKKAVQRGADLVRQLLTFARKSDPSFELINVNDTVAEVAHMLNQTFPKTIAIKVELAEAMPRIIADATQLHQALLNLCVNARDAMLDDTPGSPGTGTLTLRTETVDGKVLHQKYSNATATHYVGLRVSDTGVGMDEATRSRMFEPFFTTKELGKGTGLGLAVVYGVVNSHHAFIDVESSKGIGTTFILYFPVPMTNLAPTIQNEPAMEGRPRGSETILIVEDEAMLADLLKSLLEERGYTVLVAADGIAGYETYQHQCEKIALVLSDMGLPRLGGWEMFLKMRERNPNVKAILASGYFDAQLKLDMLKAGAKDFIQKPYVAEVVLTRIREVIDEA